MNNKQLENFLNNKTFDKIALSSSCLFFIIYLIFVSLVFTTITRNELIIFNSFLLVLIILPVVFFVKLGIIAMIECEIVSIFQRMFLFVYFMTILTEIILFLADVKTGIEMISAKIVIISFLLFFTIMMVIKQVYTNYYTQHFPIFLLGAVLLFFYGSLLVENAFNYEKYKQNGQIPPANEEIAISKIVIAFFLIFCFGYAAYKIH